METRIITSEKVWMEGLAIEQFKKTTELNDMVRAVAFPDLHPGKGMPIGAAFITANMLYPYLIGSDIGCGIGLWQTAIKTHKIKLDKWVKKLDSFSLSNNPEELGSIGHGNHFMEILRVETVENKERFDDLKLDSKRVFVMVHSGSRGLGDFILRQYVDKHGANGVAPDSEDGKRYLEGLQQATEWARANRRAVAGKTISLLGTAGDCVTDAFHNTIEPLDDNLWLHRKGAVAAFNDPVIIAGSRGDFSYLVQPVNSGMENAFSLAHGAGRKWKRNEVRGRMSHKYKPDSLRQTELGSRVICHDRDLLYEEAPQAYKPIETVIDALRAEGLIDVIATFRPLITYKKGAGR